MRVDTLYTDCFNRKERLFQNLPLKKFPSVIVILLQV